jgi:hypothetical protein
MEPVGTTQLKTRHHQKVNKTHKHTCISHAPSELTLNAQAIDRSRHGRGKIQLVAENFETVEQIDGQGQVRKHWTRECFVFAPNK